MIGRVRIKEDPQTPMSHVDVYVVGHDWEAATSTNNTGHFELINVCPDDLEMWVDKDGYQSSRLITTMISQTGIWSYTVPKTVSNEYRYLASCVKFVQHYHSHLLSTLNKTQYLTQLLMLDTSSRRW